MYLIEKYPSHRQNRNACTLCSRYTCTYKDWCTHVADRYSRRCWTSFRLLVPRKPTIPAGLATVHLKKRGKKNWISNLLLLLFCRCFEYQWSQLSSEMLLTWCKMFWLLYWYDWGDQTSNPHTHTPYMLIQLSISRPLSLFTILYDATVSPTLWPSFSVRSIFHER